MNIHFDDIECDVSNIFIENYIHSQGINFRNVKHEEDDIYGWADEGWTGGNYDWSVLTGNDTIYARGLYENDLSTRIINGNISNPKSATCDKIPLTDYMIESKSVEELEEFLNGENWKISEMSLLFEGHKLIPLLRHGLTLYVDTLRRKLVFDIECGNTEYIVTLLKEDLLCKSASLKIFIILNYPELLNALTGEELKIFYSDHIIRDKTVKYHNNDLLSMYLNLIQHISVEEFTTIFYKGLDCSLTLDYLDVIDTTVLNTFIFLENETIVLELLKTIIPNEESHIIGGEWFQYIQCK